MKTTDKIDGSTIRAKRNDDATMAGGRGRGKRRDMLMKV
jgi:hypothetical protein